VAAILKFNGLWRFTSPGPIAANVSNDFYNLIGKVVAQGNRRQLLEHFKTYFAGAAGMVSNWSSDEGWADTDLRRYMDQATENAPLFIEAFYGCACRKLDPGILVMQSAQDWATKNVPGAIDGARDRRIFLQG
jgi:hypothetical protein